MAAPKENLLSLGHLTGSERNTFTKQRGHRQKKSVNRPTLLQADFSTPQSHQQLRAMHLQQRWQELKERELTAQHHNRQLLKQFEEAQDTLSEMMSLTAAMKTIRTEYERYLEESSARWQQQLKEKTRQAAQKKRMEEYLRSCLKNTEERMTTSSADRHLLSQGSTTMPQNIAASPKHYSPNSHLDYNQAGSPHLPYMHSSWQTHPQPQMAGFPIRAPYQPPGSSHVHPSFLRHPHSFQLHQPASTPGDRHPLPRQSPPGWAASLQPNYLWSLAAGIPSASEALWGQLYTKEPPPETEAAGEEADTSRAPSSKRERGGGGRSRHSSQELDIKPVRLSGGHAESSESSRESSQVSREKRKKRQERGRSHRSSSERESCSSQESSGTSSAVVIAAVTVAQSSGSDASSEKGRISTSMRTRRRSGGLAVGSPRGEKVAKGSKGDDSGSHKEESQSTSEEVGSLIEESRSEKAENESPNDKSESCGEESGSKREEESGSVSIKIEKGGGDEIEKQESSSSEQSSDGEKVEEDLGDGEDGDAEEKEKSQTDEEQEERDVEEDDDDDEDEVSERKTTTEEEEETGAEEEVEEKGSEVKGDRDEEESDSLNNEDGEEEKKGSASSQDEEEDKNESEGGEEDGESDEEEQRGDLAGGPEEERDSDDSIVSPQDKSKKMHIIPEEASEDEEEEEEEKEEEEEEGSKSGSPDDDSNEFSDEEDVEHLLAPQEQSQKKEEKEPRADEKPKAICDNVEMFRVEPDKSTKSDHLSDSDEFDHFYS